MKPTSSSRRVPWRVLFPVVALVTLLLLAAPPRASEQEVALFAYGDWGSDTPAQKEVAGALTTYAGREGIRPDAVLLLGDNFYVDLPGGVKDRRWRTLFEELYDPKTLAAPFYAVLGNHDYSDGKDRIQLDYSRQNPGSRFRMPGRWYRVDLPPGAPIVTLIGLDSNVEELGDERWAEENRWLAVEMAKPRVAAWVVCFAHHPLFSDSEHGDDARLQEAWGAAFRRSGVDFYLAGHDHVQEALEVPGWPTAFLISGGGGYEAYEVHDSDRSRYARGGHGFVHLALTRERARVTFVDEEGRVLWSRDRARPIP